MCMAGNLHLNVIAEVYSKEIEEALEPFVYELVGTSYPISPCPGCLDWSFTSPASHKGSISAEHGVGQQKLHALHYSKSKESTDIMRRVKKLFDERGIMNPGKVLE
jgi:hypothetical protein